MTSKLRPAVEVWDLLWDAFTGTPPQSGNPNARLEAAAAVIEADREAVRAPLLAEIERLRTGLSLIAHHTSHEAVSFEEYYECCRTIARAALAGDSHDQ